MNGVQIPVLTEMRYLGIQLDHWLCFSRLVHCANCSVTALRCMVLSASIYLNRKKTFKRLCLTTVLSIILYNLIVAFPDFEKYANGLESVHRFATRLILKNNDLELSKLLQHLERTKISAIAPPCSWVSSRKMRLEESS